MRKIYLLLTSLLYTAALMAQCGPQIANDTSQFTTDNPVAASLVRGNILYLGGSFNKIEQYTGHFAGIDTATGDIVNRATWPKVNSTVYKVIADGAGGWIIGGVFTTVGDSARLNLAQIDATGNVTAFNPQADGAVKALLLSGSQLYIGGNFRNIAGVARGHIASVSFPAGMLSAWAPEADTTVGELEEYYGRIYAGGTFTNIGGHARNFIAVLDSAFGLATAWDAATLGSSVQTITFHGSKVYVGGVFNVIGGVTRTNAAALDTGTAAAGTWDPYTNFAVAKLLFMDTSVYMAGSFSNVHDSLRNGFAEVDTLVGKVTLFNPERTTVATLTHPFYDMVVSGNNIFLGGAQYSYALGLEGRFYVATFNIAANAAVPFKWTTDSTIYTIGISGGRLFAGGEFRHIGKVRHCLAAIDMAADTITAWQPGVDGYITSLEAGPSYIYAGGAFTFYDYHDTDVFAHNMIAVDPVTGVNDVTFVSQITDGGVTGIVYNGGYLYVAGQFTDIGSLPRKYLGKISATTGNPDGAWSPSPTSATYISAIADDGNGHLVIGGGFNSLGGAVRHSLGAVSLTTAVPTSWNPVLNVGGVISSLSVNNGEVFIGGQFDSVGTKAINNLAKVNITTGIADAWDPAPNGNVTLIAPYYNTEIVGGLFDHIGTMAASGLGSVNLVNNIPDSWDPAPGSNTVRAVSAYGDRLYVAGSYTSISGTATQPYLILYKMQTVPDTISITGAATLCSGMADTFTAAAGVPGDYQWRVNGINVGTDADTFSYVPTNGDVVSCFYTVSVTGCFTSDSASSNSQAITVDPLTIPSITISAPPSATVGATVTVNAVIGSISGAYNIEWFDNGTLFNTTTVPVVTYTKAAGTDHITARVVPVIITCYDSATSASITVTTDNTGVNGVSVTPLHIYPNPANEALHIDGVSTQTTFEIYSVVRELMQRNNLAIGDNIINVKMLPTGVYLLEMTGSDNKRVIEKFIKE